MLVRMFFCRSYFLGLAVDVLLAMCLPPVPLHFIYSDGFSCRLDLLLSVSWLLQLEVVFSPLCLPLLLSLNSFAFRCNKPTFHYIQTKAWREICCSLFFIIQSQVNAWNRIIFAVLLHTLGIWQITVFYSQ